MEWTSMDGNSHVKIQVPSIKDDFSGPIFVSLGNNTLDH